MTLCLRPLSVIIMPSLAATKQTTQMSDEAVQAKTGKNWAEWFELLDAAGAQMMDHKQLVAYLKEQHQLSGW